MDPKIVPNRRRPAPLIAAGLAACLLLGACETQPLQQLQQLKEKLPFQAGDARPVVLDAPLPPAPERKWADAAEDVNNYRGGGWGLVNMPAMRVYLNGLYGRLKAMGGHPDWPGEVYVLADPSLKSTSSAAGNVYLSLAWLQSIESEDEIFALLAHEYGHVYLGHHVIYEATDAGDMASRLGMVAVSLANRAAQATTPNGVVAISVIRDVAASTLVPGWKRSVEEEADTFGVTLSLRAGYSYARGFKTFLERIATYDDGSRELAAKALTETERREREAAVKGVVERARQQQGNKPDPSGLNAGFVDLQVKLQESMSDAGASMSRTMAGLAGRLRETHADAASREDSLSKQVAGALAGRPRVAARTAPWEAARKEPATAEILAHYAMLAQVDDALARRAYPEALKLATASASGRTATDALPLYTLAVATLQANPRAVTTDLARRHLAAPERSWKFELMAIDGETRRNRVNGRAMLEQQFAYFQKAPALWPDVIAYYRDNGYLPEAKAMAQTCIWKLGNYRDACIVSSTTEAERKEQQAATDRKAKELVDKYGPKMK